jgi:hypothetical protein
MKLPFAPACAPLLLGGLPHRSAAQAMELSRRYAGDLLAWPQLPQRSFREQTFVQGAAGFPGLVIDAERSHVHVDRKLAEQAVDSLGLAYLEDRTAHAALAADDAAGFEELLRQGDMARGARAVKGQLMGPISLAAQLTDERDSPLIYDEMLFEALAQHLGLRMQWQEARLRGVNATTIMCLDEPFLDSIGLPFLPLDWERAREQLALALRGVRGCRAIFAGGAVNWAEVIKAPIDMIIADVFEHGQSLVDAAPALAELLDRGGCVGLGVVPNDEDALGRTSAAALADLVGLLVAGLESAGLAAEQVMRQAIISSVGTLSRLPVPTAERAVQLVAEVSSLLREQYQLA